jgi:hypothetical protein
VKHPRIWIGALILASSSLWFLQRVPAVQGEPAYAGAFIDYRQQLEVFPSTGRELTLSLPIGPARITYSRDGRSLYSFGDTQDRTRRGLFKIDFDPTRVTTIDNSESFSMVNGFAVSLSKSTIIISGKYSGKDSSSCGLFELDAGSGSVRKIIENPTCAYSQSWVRLSLSSDGKRLVAYRKPSLELIDLADGAIRSLGEEYITGSWSPDGKWLAVLEGGRNYQTILLNASNLEKTRVLVTSTGQWSPDSRFLLGEGGLCSPYWSSLMAIDIQSGKAIEIASSHCKVNLNTTGWVSNTLLNENDPGRTRPPAVQ